MSEAGLYSPGLAGRTARALDGAIALAFPGWARRRIESRAAVAANLNYEAARSRRNRRTQKASSADVDALSDLPQLRMNSRSMARDDSTGAALIRVIKDGGIGTGILPQSIVTMEETGFSDKEADDYNMSCEQWFLEWAEDQADATGHDTFFGLQRQVCQSLVVDGECLAKRTSIAPTPGGRRVAAAIELIDADRIMSPSGMSDRDIRTGVELGPFGEAIAYWITPRHPDETRWNVQGRTFNPGNANLPAPFPKTSGGLPLCMHVFDRQRMGLSRGVPWMAASFPLVEALNDVRQSEVIASKVVSKIAVFIKQTLQPTNSALSQSAEGNGEWSEKLPEGSIRYLNEGEEPVMFNPNRPGSSTQDFLDSILKAICASFGLSKEWVMRDFSRMNYSSARVAIMESRRPLEHLQELIVQQFCMPWWRIVITEGILRGEIRLPRLFGQNPRPFFRTMWVPPSWGYVDPEKEIAASRSAVDGNVSTPQIEASRNGLKARTILLQKARFQREAREIENANGLPEGALTPASGPAAAKLPAPANDQAPQDQNQNEAA